MPDTVEATQTLASFREDPTEFLNQLKATHSPITLTINGKAVVILQNPAEYQRLLDLAAAASPEEGIRQGLADLAAGRSRPASEVFPELRHKYNIPR